MKGMIAAILLAAAAAAPPGDLASFVGTWHGTSTCVDLKFAPACKNEVVIYDVRPADKPGAAILAPDKVVNGERQPMGELEFTYDDKEGCWASAFKNERVNVLWCLKIKDRTMTGWLRDVPTKTVVRKAELTRD